MRRLARSGILAAVILTPLLLAAHPVPARAQQDCTEWTDWDPVEILPVLWSWRRCEAAGDRYDVQWRFANEGSEPVEFRYEFYTGSVVGCGEQSRGRIFAQGKYRLDGGQRSEGYSGRKTVRRDGFEEGFWLGLCLYPIESEP
jgi:hypothetical protein